MKTETYILPPRAYEFFNKANTISNMAYSDQSPSRARRARPLSNLLFARSLLSYSKGASKMLRATGHARMVCAATACVIAARAACVSTWLGESMAVVEGLHLTMPRALVRA